MSVNSRWQALKFYLDTMIVVVIQISDQFLFEVIHRVKLLEIEQFAFEQTEEVFHHSIIQTIAFSAHALNDTVIRQFFW